MAVIKLSPTKLNEYNVSAATPAATTVTSDGMDLDFTGKAHRILIMVTEAAATITAGNGLQGGGQALTVSAGQSVVLDSGYYKHVSGAHKGCVYITGATAKIQAIELP